LQPFPPTPVNPNTSIVNPSLYLRMFPHPASFLPFLYTLPQALPKLCPGPPFLTPLQFPPSTRHSPPPLPPSAPSKRIGPFFFFHLQHVLHSNPPPFIPILAADIRSIHPFSPPWSSFLYLRLRTSFFLQIPRQTSFFLFLLSGLGFTSNLGRRLDISISDFVRLSFFFFYHLCTLGPPPPSFSSLCPSLRISIPFCSFHSVRPRKKDPPCFLYAPFLL